MSKCPKCDSSISQLHSVLLPVKVGKGEVPGTLFTCPNCAVVLGAGVDPQAMIKKTAEAVIATLRKG